MPSLSDNLPSTLVQKITNYVPFEPLSNVSTGHRDMGLTCAPSPTEYRTLQNEDGACPTVEASYREPGASLCCSSRHQTAYSQLRSLRYMAILREVALRSPIALPNLPDDIRRLLRWMTHSQNQATFPPVTLQSPWPGAPASTLIMSPDYPHFADVVKFAIMLKSRLPLSVRVNQQDYEVTEPLDSFYVNVYPALPVHSTIVRVTNQVGAEIVTVDVSNVVGDFTPLPPLNTKLCIVRGNETTMPTRLRDVKAYFKERRERGWKKDGYIALNRLVVAESSTSMLDAFVGLLQEMQKCEAVHVSFQNYTNEVVPAGYTAIQFPSYRQVFFEEVADALGGRILQSFTEKTVTVRHHDRICLISWHGQSANVRSAKM